MFHINDYFTRLPGSYLFAEIARRVASGDLTVEVQTASGDTDSMMAAIKDMVDGDTWIVGTNVFVNDSGVVTNLGVSGAIFDGTDVVPGTGSKKKGDFGWNHAEGMLYHCYDGTNWLRWGKGRYWLSDARATIVAQIGTIDGMLLWDPTPGDMFVCPADQVVYIYNGVSEDGTTVDLTADPHLQRHHLFGQLRFGRGGHPQGQRSPEHRPGVEVDHQFHHPVGSEPPTLGGGLLHLGADLSGALFGHVFDGGHEQHLTGREVVLGRTPRHPSPFGHHRHRAAGPADLGQAGHCRLQELGPGGPAPVLLRFSAGPVDHDGGRFSKKAVIPSRASSEANSRADMKAKSSARSSNASNRSPVINGLVSARP